MPNTGSLSIELYPIIINYMNMKDIICQMMPLSSALRDTIKNESYLLYKKFLKYFCLNKRLKRNALPAFYDVFTLIKDNATLNQFSQPNVLSVFTYYTDGGVYND